MKLNRILLLAALIAMVAMWGCEGDQGPAGQDGQDGHDGAGISQYTYVGKNGADCMHCHMNTVASVVLTKHTGAYDSLVDDGKSTDNPYCLQCHVTGWDSEVNYGDTEIGVYGPDVNGYDDYWGVEGDEAAARRADLEGVQCESCHGPMGPNFNSNSPIISFGTHEENGVSTSMCVKCHTGQVAEWMTSGHAMAAGGDIAAFNDEHYAHIGSCNGCHTSEGFIRDNDPAFADYDFGHDVSFVGCVTCHDPHAGSMGDGNEAQLRNVGPVEVSYDPASEPGDAERPTMDGYGPAQTCAQCHHGRRGNDNVAGQIANGYAHFGPHHSAQMDMFIGAGSYEIEGYDYDRTSTHQAISHACVDCHMVRMAEIHGTNQEHSFHSFTPEVGSCTSCHVSWTDFSVLEASQTALHDKMDDLAVLFGYTDFVDMEENWDSEAEGVLPWQREAAYAAFFIVGDGSLGAHNPAYANDLIDNAIAYYQSKALP
jgi:formate-dependent nitrite reductase cytochrome c552 subunit